MCMAGNMPTGTTTRSERGAVGAVLTGTATRVDVCCEIAGGATRLTRLDATGLLRARMLPSRDGVARVALVQTAASLLGGDKVELRLECGAGSRLELVEVAGTVAHDVRGGPGARLDVRVMLGPGARMSWAARPLTLAAGCDLERDTCVVLDDGAALLWRDTLVLGRAGEMPGRMVAGLDVRCDGVDLHAERFETGDRELLCSPVVLGAGARVLDTLALYGTRAAASTGDGGTLQLAGPGTIRPLPAPSLATSARTLDPLQARWRAELFCDDHPEEGTTDGLRLALSTVGSG
jgi:urease accessory protein